MSDNASKIAELKKEIDELRSEWDRIDNGTQCERQGHISEKIGRLQDELKLYTGEVY